MEPLGDPLAVGRTAEIYAWGDRQVLKLFRPSWDEAAASTEAKKVRVVHAGGLPVPAVIDLITINGRSGIIYERINGTSLTENLVRRPWKLTAAARLLAGLHVTIHSQACPGLPGLHERLKQFIQSVDGMPEDIRGAVLRILAGLAEGNAVCHGDFHPENLLITASGTIILDWMDASSGHPLADVARTSLLLTKSALPPELPGRRLIQVIRNPFNRIYLKRYLQMSGIRAETFKDWLTVIVAARLAEDIAEERPRLMALLNRLLKQKR